MEAIDFNEVNFRIAEDQPEYETLPVYVDINDEALPATCCFKLNEEELKQIAETGCIWLTQLTFGQKYSPIHLSVLKPTIFK